MEYKFREDRVILMGDTHSTSITHDLLKAKIPTRSDVVHVGDGGWGYGNIAYAIDNARSWADKINRLCQDFNIMLYHVIGNHDNPDCWNIWNHEAYSNLKFVRTGEVGVFPNGKRVLFVGGGISIDRLTSIEGESYWTDEVTPYLDTVPECDIVITHDAPEYFNHSTKSLVRNFNWYVEKDPTLLDDCYKQRKNISDICERSGAKSIYGGHFHNNATEYRDDVYYRCLGINELYELKA